MGLLERFRGPKELPVEDQIKALKEEFANTECVILQPYNYRAATEEEKNRPAYRMSKELVEILHVQEVTKSKGEIVSGRFVYQPTSGKAALLRLINFQEEEEIESGKTLRFNFPDQAKQLFNATGTGRIYVQGEEGKKWVFGVNISWSIPETLI